METAKCFLRTADWNWQLTSFKCNIFLVWYFLSIRSLMVEKGVAAEFDGTTENVAEESVPSSSSWQESGIFGLSDNYIDIWEIFRSRRWVDEYRIYLWINFRYFEILLSNQLTVICQFMKIFGICWDGRCFHSILYWSFFLLSLK